MKPKSLTPVRAIREHCLECQGFSYKATLHCPSTECRFYLYRRGTLPSRKGIGGFRSHKKHSKIGTQVAAYQVGLKDNGPKDTKPTLIPKTPITPQFLKEIEGLLDKVANLVQDDTVQLIEKVKSLKLLMVK